MNAGDMGSNVYCRGRRDGKTPCFPRTSAHHPCADILAYLRPFQTIELAKTGDSEKTQLLAELTLEMRNEAAHGIVADLAV